MRLRTRRVTGIDIDARWRNDDRCEVKSLLRSEYFAWNCPGTIACKSERKECDGNGRYLNTTNSVSNAAHTNKLADLGNEINGDGGGGGDDDIHDDDGNYIMKML
jgi:hypothetical protein